MAGSRPHEQTNKQRGHAQVRQVVTQRSSLVHVWGARIAAPVVAVSVYLLLPESTDAETALSAAGRATAAIACCMAFLWATEAIPLPATALLPVLLFPLTGVLSMRDAAAPYAHEFIFLFLGGFMLALAMERWGLHRRIALLCLLAVGSRPDRVVGGFMVSTALLSMWISNTACTIMMLPIALGVIERLRADSKNAGALETSSIQEDPFAISLLLGIAYAASIGGMGTLIGTPPNVFLAGFLETSYAIHLGFGRWMLIGVPLVVVFLPLAWFFLTRILFAVPRTGAQEGRSLFRREYQELGRVSAGEKRVLVVFVATVLLWMLREPLQSWAALTSVLPGLQHLTDAGISVMAALVLFFLPVQWQRPAGVLDWQTAERLPWGILLLFGGGLSLASAFQSSGLAAWISQQSVHLQGLPFVLLLLLVIVAIVFLTELTSNTATAATFLPVLGGVASGLHLDPVLLAVPAALAASCAFMMPVATPPNAIVFGSGYLRMRHMLRAGLILNSISVFLLMAVTFGIVVHVISKN